MLPKPCRVCGKPGKAICDQCKPPSPPKPSRQSRGYDTEYDHNRRIVIDRAWAQHEPCWLCGQPFDSKSDITADHIIPIRDGGNNALTNLAPAHRRCNYGWNRNQHQDNAGQIGTDPWS